MRAWSFTVGFWLMPWQPGTGDFNALTTSMHLHQIMYTQIYVIQKFTIPIISVHYLQLVIPFVILQYRITFYAIVSAYKHRTGTELYLNWFTLIYSQTCVTWSLGKAATSLLQPLSSSSKWQNSIHYIAATSLLPATDFQPMGVWPF